MIFRAGLNKRFKDPSLTFPQILIATFWAMEVLYYADTTRGVALLVYLAIFIFGLFKLNVRQFLFLSFFTIAGYSTVILLLYIHHPESINVKTEILNIVVLAIVLPWFSLIGGYITRLKAKVSDTIHRIQETELKFGIIFNNASDGIIVVHMHDWKFSDANEKMCDLLGYAKEELLQLGISDIHTPEAIHFVAEQFEKLLRKETSTARSIPVLRKNGTEFFADISASTVVLGGREYVVGLFRDITERKKTEEIIRQSEAQYRLLADHMKDYVWLMDLNLQWQYISPSIEKMLGYSLHELQQLSLDHILTEKSLKSALDRFAAEMPKNMASRETIPYEVVLELECRSRDGSDFWLECTFSIIRDANGKPVRLLGEGRDITERREAEEKIHQSEKKYRKILEDMQEGYFETDLAGNLTFFNDSVCRIFGYSEEELMGMNYRQYTDQEESKKVYQAYHDVYKTGKTNSEFGWQIIIKDGTRRYVEGSVSLLKDSTGRPAGFRGITRDVTERKLMEDQLRREEQRFRALVEHSSDIIVVVNLKGNITYINPAVEQVLGYRPEERIGAKGFELVHPDDLKFLSESFSTLANDANASVITGEMRLHHKDGSWHTFEAIGSNRVNGKVVEAVIVNYRDITERKRAEEELRKSEQRYLELSIIDDLTQLYNSRHFYAQLEKEMERSKRYGQPLTLMMIDLDNFKAFNDRYGHVEGDNVLSRLGQVIKRCLRDPDSAYRYGGEEFTITLPMTTDRDGIVTAERIQNEFSKEVFKPAAGEEVMVTMSIGISQYKPDEDMKEFVHRVDQLMYQAKKNGKNMIITESSP